MRVAGTATRLGDDVDTDTIFPGRYLAVLRPEDQARHLFEPLDEDLRRRLISGGVIVGGWNFGCGSSREHAVTSMIGAGIRLVIARSFSRIFFRNAVNNGLAVLVSPDIAGIVADGDAIVAHLESGVASVAETEYRFDPLPAEVLSVLTAGGLWAAHAGVGPSPSESGERVSSPDTGPAVSSLDASGFDVSGHKASGLEAKGLEAKGLEARGSLAEKIMGRLAGRTLKAGEMVEIAPDWTFALDDGIGLIEQNFRRFGIDRLAAPEKIALFYDHYAPADTPLHAHVQRIGRKLFDRFGLARERLFDVGEGISHQIAVESGMVRPGQMVTNMDSHTITIGAIGAIGCGIGGAEMAFLWAHGRLWFRVPESIRIELDGSLPPGTAAKDVVLAVLQRISARGAIYSSIEFHGSAVDAMSIPERMTLCNMGIEMGAKFAVVPPDEVTRAHFRSLDIDIGELIVPDADARYASRHRIDLAALEPLLSVPSKVDNVHAVSAFSSVRINQAFLGTCTNGRFEDFEVAAAILKGRRLAPGVRMIVTPASRKVYLKALASGVIATLVDAGATVTTPGCGACAGMHQGVLAEEEVCIASSSRNFLGRMGHRDAAVYLGSPATVAASAVTGYITDPRRFMT